MGNGVTRRKFLRTASAAAMGIAVGTRGVLGDAAKNALVSKAKLTTRQAACGRLRVAAIGVGGMGGVDLQAVANTGATIVALCDVDSDRLAAAGEKHASAKRFSDFREMLHAMEKQIDAVIVGTPDHTHAVATMMAIKMGKGVYCEKPLTHDIYEARMIAAAASKFGVATQMGIQGHSAAGSAQQVQWVRDERAIGEVSEVHLWTNRPVWPQGLNRPSEAPPVPKSLNWDLFLGTAPQRPYNPCYEPFKWRGWWDFGTGALGDMGCHIMDTAYWALDLKEPTAVEAIVNDGATVESPPTRSVIRYDFPARGDRGAMKVFWYDGGELPSAKLIGGQPLNKDGGLIFVGEKGTIMANVFEKPVIVEESLRKSFKAPPPPASVAEHHQQWVDACLGGKSATANFEYAGPLTEMVLLGNLAIRVGKRIEWDSKKMQVVNSHEGQKYVKREYRAGWEL